MSSKKVQGLEGIQVARALAHLHSVGRVGEILAKVKREEGSEKEASGADEGYFPLKVKYDREGEEVVAIGGKRQATGEALVSEVARLIQAMPSNTIRGFSLPISSKDTGKTEGDSLVPSLAHRVRSYLRANEGAYMVDIGRSEGVRLTVDTSSLVDGEQDEDPVNAEIILVYSGSHGGEGKKGSGKKKSKDTQITSQATQALDRVEKKLREVVSACQEYPQIYLPISVPRIRGINEAAGKGVWSQVEGQVRDWIKVTTEPDGSPSYYLEVQREGGDVSGVWLWGPGGTESKLVQKVRRALQDEESQVREKSYVRDVTLVAGMGRLIGKDGAGLEKIRERYGVSGVTAEAGGRIRLVGEKSQVDEAAESLESWGRMVEGPEHREVLPIPTRFHVSLIGPAGRYVRRLEDRYGVRVAFQSTPRAEGSGQGDEAGQVTVSGGALGVEGATEELKELWAWERENRHRKTLEGVNPAVLRHIVGKNGTVISRIRDVTGTKLDIIRSTEEGSGKGEGLGRIEIEGPIDGVKEAERLIRAIITEQESVTTERIQDIPIRLHRSLIGPGGSVLREIVRSAGGTDADAGMVRFPKGGHDSTPTPNGPNEEEGKEGGGEEEGVILVRGERSLVGRIVEALRERAKVEADKVVDTIVIPRADRPLLIGRGGNNLRSLEERYGVSVRLPPRKPSSTGPKASGEEEEGEEDAPVRIIGSAEGVAGAKAEMAGMIRSVQTLTVPRSLHRSAVGQFIRRFRSELDVIVEDDARRSGEEESVAGSEEGSVVHWTLRGPEAGVQEAAKLLEAFTLSGGAEDGHEAEVTEFIEVEPQLHRVIVGRGGRGVRHIREATGCYIHVPPKASAGEEEDDRVKVSGPTADAVSEAISMIEDTISGFRHEDNE